MPNAVSTATRGLGTSADAAQLLAFADCSDPIGHLIAPAGIIGVNVASHLKERTLAKAGQERGQQIHDLLRELQSRAATNDPAGAEPLYRRAFEARERILGPGYPDTLDSLNNLAHQRGRSAEALPLMLRAAEGRERVLGPEHPGTIVSRQGLDTIRRAVGKEGE